MPSHNASTRLDRDRVAGWTKRIFGHDRIRNASFVRDDIPTATVLADSLDGNREVCDVLGIDPEGVLAVHLDRDGAWVQRRGDVTERLLFDDREHHDG